MDTRRARVIAGTALVTGGAVTVLGFVTAEALYPGYSAADQTISSLGSKDAPPGPQTVFNAAMILAGVLLVGAAGGLQRIYEHRLFTAIAGVTGLGVVAVGVFPEHTGVPHVIAAFLAFGGTGLTALAAASVLDEPFRYVSAVFGGLELLAFAAFVALGDGTALGIGGLERWVAYLGLLWVTAFGGFLLSTPTSERAQG
jgi:hypothetical membrane protein